MRFCQASYTVFTRCNNRGDWLQLQLGLQLSCNSGFNTVSHELNMFNYCDRPCDCCADYTD